jgi:hypothetical protein
MKWRRASWIGQILHSNCLLKHDIVGKLETTGARERRRKQLLDDLIEDARTWMTKHWIAVSGDRGLEEAIYLSKDSLHIEWINYVN